MQCVRGRSWGGASSSILLEAWRLRGRWLRARSKSRLPHAQNELEETMKSKLIKALKVAIAAKFFFVGPVPHAGAKEKKNPTATAETCPLPFCATNPGKSCTTISDPNLSYFCGTQTNTPFRKQAATDAGAKE